MFTSEPGFHPLMWLLAATPVLLLVGAILIIKWKAHTAALTSWLLAIGIATILFGVDPIGIGISSAKGLSLSIFVLTIIWSSVYLFNIANLVKAIERIGRGVTGLVQNRVALALLIGWGFAGFIQGITGFGVPVAVATPFLVITGFPVIRAATIALIGHGWAVAFGSLGGPYYSIQLVTGIPGDTIGPHMALLCTIPIISTGLVVAHIEGGMAGVKQLFPVVLVTGIVMSVGLFLTTLVGAPQIATVIAGLLCILCVAVLSRTPLLLGSTSPATPNLIQSTDQLDNSSSLGFHKAFTPYYCLIFLSVISQFPLFQTWTAGFGWGFDYPGFVTDRGFSVAAVENFAKIRFLNHPAALIGISTMLTIVIYQMSGTWLRGAAGQAFRLTYIQCRMSSIAIAAMCMMAMVMADSGMTTILAQEMAVMSGAAFPLISPYIGMLGAIITGSNANSNVMFGALQVEAAKALEISSVTIASIQSIGGSVGSSLAPAKIVLAASLLGITGEERSILKMVIPYVLILVLLIGVEAMLAITFFSHVLP